MNEPFPAQLPQAQADWQESVKRLCRTWAFVARNHRFVWPEVGHPTVPLPDEPAVATGNNLLTFRNRGDKPFSIA